MRNLARYPMTDAEIDQCLKEFGAGCDSEICGDMRPSLLRAASERLARASQLEEATAHALYILEASHGLKDVQGLLRNALTAIAKPSFYVDRDREKIGKLIDGVWRIELVDFSKFPGPGLIKDGPHSGEAFRAVMLKALQAHDKVVVVLDGTVGIGFGFFEEAFGGLIEKDGFSLAEINSRLVVVARDDESYLYNVKDAFLEAEDNSNASLLTNSEMELLRREIKESSAKVAELLAENPPQFMKHENIP